MGLSKEMLEHLAQQREAATQTKMKKAAEGGAISARTRTPLGAIRACEAWSRNGEAAMDAEADGERGANSGDMAGKKRRNGSEGEHRVVRQRAGDGEPEVHLDGGENTASDATLLLQDDPLVAVSGKDCVVAAPETTPLVEYPTSAMAGEEARTSAMIPLLGLGLTARAGDNRINEEAGIAAPLPQVGGKNTASDATLIPLDDPLAAGSGRCCVATATETPPLDGYASSAGAGK